MSTLLVELAGPQQAGGSRSRCALRATGLAPTRSGVVGLVAAALGLPRTASLDRFAGLRFGVRVDQPRCSNVISRRLDRSTGGTSFRSLTRFHLADAVFLAALGSDELAELDAIKQHRRPGSPSF